MGYLVEQHAKASNEFKDDDLYSDRSKEAKHYTIKDIMENLYLVNAGIAVVERGGHEKITGSMLLSPYSLMHYDYSSKGNRTYLKTTSGGKPKFIQKEMCRITKEFIEREFKYFEHVLYGLQKNNLYRIIYEHKRKGLRKYEQRRIERRIDRRPAQSFSNKEDRLYPLSDEQYNKFARSMFRKHKAPRFGKHFIDGVKFGSSYVKYYKVGQQFNGVSRSQHSTMQITGVDERCFGLKLCRSKNNAVQLGYEVDDDGVFVIDTKHNGRRSHLWVKLYGTNGRNPLFTGRGWRNMFYGYGSKRRSKELYDSITNTYKEVCRREG